MSLRIKILLLIMGGVLAVSLFYLRVLARRVFTATPKQAEETIRARLSEVALQSAKGPNQTATLYFPSLDGRGLIPESRPITWAENDSDKVRQVLLALIEGPRRELGRPLPPSTKIRAVFLLSDGTAYVDFPSDVSNTPPVAAAAPGPAPAGLEPGIASESLAIYSVVNSITANVPSVKRVMFLVQGREVDTLDGHADLTEAYVSDMSRIQTPSARP